MRNRRIGVLMGGLSSEREVSRRSGLAVHAALVERGHQAVPLYVDNDLDLAIRAEGIEVAFLALHGRYGEDGCVQGLLELGGIPYTGSSVLASALAADKAKTKELLRLHNLPTPPAYLVDAARATGEALTERHGGFGFPVVVKPRAAGSSLGVRRADDLATLEAACEEALGFDEHVLVERFVDGQELHVAVLGGRALGAIEVERPPRRLYDASARLEGGLPLHVPPRLSPERLRGAVALAERAVRALGASGLCEVDLVVSARGNEQLLEVDTQPALGPHSLVPKIAHAAGLDFEALVEAILAEARLHTRRRTTPAADLAPAVERRAATPIDPH